MVSVWEELKRRNVVRVALAYAVVAWLLLQVADVVLNNIEAPAWLFQAILLMLAIGFPVALIFAWAFELTPEGLKKEQDIDRSNSIAQATGRKLDFAIIGVLVVVVGFFLVDKFYLGADEPDSDEIIATERQSIAVLPFVNMSDDADHFADGLSEELMNLLAKNPELKIAGRTSSFAFKGQTPDIEIVGDALGVQHVLEGSVRRSGDRLRVTAQLIKVDDGFHVWSETYDRTMADIFDIQDDVASSISRELEIKLLPNSGRPTDNAEAYALYVEALPYIANNDHPDIVEIVIDLLDRALKLDPGFAKAQEAKALTYWISSGGELDSGDARKLVEESANRALELDESLVLARYLDASAGYPLITWNDEFIAAEAALSADPDNFGILRAWCNNLIHAGYFRKAIECTDRIIRLEPLSPVGHWRAGNVFGALGQRDEARRSYLRGAAGSGSDYVLALVLEAAIAGDFDRAVEDAVAAPDEYGWQPDDIRRVQQWVEADDDAAIMSWIEEKTGAAADFYQRNSMHYWYLALGKLDEYWSVIDQIQSDAGDSWDNSGYLLEYGYAFREKGMLRHPAYLRYAGSSGLFDLWERRGAPDYCSRDSGEWVCQ